MAKRGHENISAAGWEGWDGCHISDEEESDVLVPEKKSRSSLEKPQPVPVADLTIDKVLVFIPDSLKGVPLQLGIDEAGRGPVLGPMVYSAAVAPLDYDDALKKHGMMDSKQTEEKERKRLFKIIQSDSNVGFVVHSLSPRHLSNNMLQRRKFSLNAISHASAIGMIQRVVDEGFDVRKIIVDTVGDAGRYEQKISGMFPGIDCTVCPKADALYPIASTASICAKVTRDEALRFWEFEEPGVKSIGSMGSGYPSDPITQKWVAANMDPVFGFPNLTRFSWRNVSTLLDEKAVAVDWHEDEDEDPTQLNLTNLFKPNKRAELFATSGLDLVTDF